MHDAVIHGRTRLKDGRSHGTSSPLLPLNEGTALLPIQSPIVFVYDTGMENITQTLRAPARRSLLSSNRVPEPQHG